MKAIFATIVLCLFLSASVRPLAMPTRTLLTADPAIKLTGIDGQTYDVEQMRGNVVLVSFGATWCTPCSAELYALEELKREYKDKRIKFFWVSIEREVEVSNKELQKYARARKLTFPVLRDPEKLAFAQFTKRVRLPLVVFYGKDGRMDTPVHVGMAAPEVYKTRIRERLNKLL